MQREMMSVMFMDVKGYSKLNEPQLERFFQVVLPDVADQISRVPTRHVNSWGDAVVVVAADPMKLAGLALEIRDLFQTRNWQEIELPRLACRIALHVGTIYFGTDPFSKKEGIVGTQINLAARIEPVTIPNQVWTTESFISLLSQDAQDNLEWDNLGKRQLAKDWGAKILYRIRYKHEPQLDSDFEKKTVDVTPRNRMQNGDEVSKVANSTGGIFPMLPESVMSKYVGHYESFHKSTSEGPVVIRSALHICVGGQVEVESFGYRYKGNFTIQDSNLYMFLAGDGHDEYMLFVFNEPLTLEFEVLTGVFVAVTEGRVPAAGRMYFQKCVHPTKCERISLETVRSPIRSFLDCPGNPLVVPKLPFP